MSVRVTSTLTLLIGVGVKHSESEVDDVHCTVTAVNTETTFCQCH